MARLEQSRPTPTDRARGLVSSRTSGARVEAARVEPPRDLADIVETLWVGRWDLPPDAPHTTRLLGDPAIHIVLGWGDDTQPARRVVGPWTGLWVRTLAGRGAVRAIKLRPGASCAVLGDASKLRDRIMPIAALFDDVPDRAGLNAEQEDDARAHERLIAWLRRRRTHHPDTSLAVRVMASVREDVTLTRVDQVVERTGLSERELQRLFKRHVGVSPKQVLRRHRLQEAAARLDRGEAPSLADLAHQLGYADQAHFARDWKRTVRATISATVRESRS